MNTMAVLSDLTIFRVGSFLAEVLVGQIEVLPIVIWERILKLGGFSAVVAHEYNGGVVRSDHIPSRFLSRRGARRSDRSSSDSNLGTNPEARWLLRRCRS